ncbi:phosphate starvation-inducible PhoH-like protein [Kribbella aluminosa]|uniref:PhoH-like protein n=1 Tax=Kribbella aluminosa TaxID=416017 RepID=A0ABS4UXX9_9ACTN|nr:phosphate starvation-inducible PhoH-like protein [Kribbella aluminosa]
MSGAVAGAQASHKIVVPNSIDMVALLGARDEFLRIVEKEFAADIMVRGNEITLNGEPAELALAERLIDELIAVIRTGHGLTGDSVERSIAMIKQATAESPADVLTQNILSSRGRTIRPKTLNQKRYVDAIDKNTIVFGIGPAGTGKTYLAVAKAVQALQAKEVTRIILTRPAVEAGERLGFLPGTLSEKIDPYLRPLYDALHDMLDPESIPRLMTAGTIEIAPLAYMRGRAQPYDAKVLTPNGYRPIGSLEIGDLVVGSNGLPTPVLGVYPRGVRDVYRVTTQDGASTICCGEHLWTVRTPEDKRDGMHRTIETSEMIGRLRRGQVRRFELPMVEPVEFEPQDVPLDPYALGLLLGEGCITTATTPSFTTADPELADALEAALDGIELRHKSRYDYVLRHVDGSRGGLRVANPVTVALRGLGLAGTKSATKFVPEVYRENSAWIRLRVLQGLLDTDGGPVTQTGRTCRVQYSTTSPRLRDDVIFLVQSLGGVAYVRPGRANGRDVGHRSDAYVLDIRLPEGLSPFRLARKQAKYDATGGGRPMRFIESIEHLGQQDTLCIQVAAEDSLYVTDDFLVTHNTLNDAYIILDEAQNTSPEQMKMFLTRLGFGSKMVVTGDITQVDLPTGTNSGLRVVQGILEGVQDLAFCRLTSHDVVRHKLVGRIVSAYENYEGSADSHR